MISCLLLDDDAAVHIYMKGFIERTPFLKLVAAYFNPDDLLKTLESETIDLIFMDVNLPGITGIELSKIINSEGGKTAPRVILISSFELYALDGYKVNAIDYLLKPILYPNFLEAAYKAKSIIEASKTKKGYDDTDYLFLKVEYESVKVYLKDVLYFEGFNNYVKVFTKNNPTFIKSLTTIKYLEEKLPAGSFIRIHRSFIVSVDKIESLTKNTIKIGKTIIPVSEQYKDVFKTFLDQSL